MIQVALRFCKQYDIWLLTAAAFVLRLFAFISPATISYGEFFRDYFTMSGLLHGTLAVLRGPPAIVGGFHFGPFYYYVIAPLFAITAGSAYALVLTGAIISALCVYALFRLMLVWSGQRELAFVAALLCTFSMYALNVTSYVSNPNFLPLFVVWFLYCLTQSLRGAGGVMNAIWLGLSFGFATQLHITATVVLVVVMAVAYAVCRPGFSLKKVSVAFAAIIISYAPYLYYECTHSFSDVVRLGQIGLQQINGRGLRVPEDPLTGVTHASNVHAIASFFSASWLPIQNESYSFTYLQPQWLNILVAGVALLFLGYILYAIFSRRRIGIQEDNSLHQSYISKEGLIILSSWVLTSLLMLFVYRHFVRYYYAIVLWPSPVILATYASEWMKRHFAIGHALAALLVVFGIIQIISWETVPHHYSWKGFYQEYAQSYAHDPDILNIGAPTIPVHQK